MSRSETQRMLKSSEPGLADVTYFRPIRPGPEAQIEAAVARSARRLIAKSDRPTWLAGSLPLGSGMPDLLAVAWEPQVIALADRAVGDSAILAYLKAVGCARLDTIVRRLGRSMPAVSEMLDSLVDADVLVRDADRFSLDPIWRQILPEVVAVEAKVSDWRRAFTQAARDQVFSHRTYVALPMHVAQRACKEERAQSLGIGVLGVSKDGEVFVLRKAQTRRPRVWSYYYQIAHHVAANANREV